MSAEACAAEILENIPSDSRGAMLLARIKLGQGERSAAVCLLRDSLRMGRYAQTAFTLFAYCASQSLPGIVIQHMLQHNMRHNHVHSRLHFKRRTAVANWVAVKRKP